MLCGFDPDYVRYTLKRLWTALKKRKGCYKKMHVEMEGQQLRTCYETKHRIIYCKTISMWPLICPYFARIQGLTIYPPQAAALRDNSYCAAKINLCYHFELDQQSPAIYLCWRNCHCLFLWLI